MKFIIFLLLIFSLNAAADNYNHIVSIGTAGFGWSGAAERNETEEKSSFADVKTYLTNLSLNYGHRIGKRFILGGYYQTGHSETKFRNGVTGRVEHETQIVGLYTLYNFSDTISSAWYTGVSVAHFNDEQEISHDIALAESKSPFELDDAGMVYEAIVGKRFSLKKWNIDHLTYAPQLGFFKKTHSKDFDDQGVKDGIGATIQPIRFDFLF